MATITVKVLNPSLRAVNYDDGTWRWIGMAIDQPLDAIWWQTTNQTIRKNSDQHEQLLLLDVNIPNGLHTFEMSVDARVENPWRIEVYFNDTIVAVQNVSKTSKIVLPLLVLGEKYFILPLIFYNFVAGNVKT